jgi:hypothetical protein
LSGSGIGRNRPLSSRIVASIEQGWLFIYFNFYIYTWGDDYGNAGSGLFYNNPRGSHFAAPVSPSPSRCLISYIMNLLLFYQLMMIELNHRIPHSEHHKPHLGHQTTLLGFYSINSHDLIFLNS